MSLTPSQAAPRPASFAACSKLMDSKIYAEICVRRKLICHSIHLQTSASIRPRTDPPKIVALLMIARCFDFDSVS